MKKFYLFFALMLSVLVTGFSSCSKDDNEPDVVGYNDFYIECECEGGGFDASTLADIENALNGELLEVKLYKLTKEDAIKIFDEFIEEEKYYWIDGASDVTGTFKMTFILKTTKGVVIKKSTINVTNETAWIS